MVAVKVVRLEGIDLNTCKEEVGVGVICGEFVLRRGEEDKEGKREGMVGKEEKEDSSERQGKGRGF